MTGLPVAPFLVVIRITPLDPLVPYIAVADASLSTSIDSIVAGLISFVCPGKGAPSRMISGVVLARMELRPRTCWLAELPGTEETCVNVYPATDPSRDCNTFV